MTTSIARLLPERVRQELQEGVDAAAHCAFCEQPIASLRNAHQKVEGWAQPRRQGGTNALALRRPLDVYACEDCIRKAKSGLDPRQGSLT